jgi:hypothetical protein
MGGYALGTAPFCPTPSIHWMNGALQWAFGQKTMIDALLTNL